MLPDQLIESELKRATESLFSRSVELQIQPTNPEFEGTHTLVCFPISKISGQAPDATARMIGDWLIGKSKIITAFNVVKGFLNLSLKDDVWLNAFESYICAPEFGIRKPNGKEIIIEYSSPNTNKPLHLGHLRNNFLGYSVAEIFHALGYTVHRVQIINDRGIHICKSMAAWQLFGKGETPETSKIKGDHLVGKYYVAFDKQYKQEISELKAKGISEDKAEKEAPIMQLAISMLQRWEQKDAEILAMWKKMNGWVYQGFSETYKRMGVHFEKLYYESETYLLGKKEILDGLERGVFFKKQDGSVWVDLSDDGLDQKVLLRSDGTSVYMTQDVGTAILRFRDFPNTEGQVYTVGNEQEYHFRVLFLILKKLGFSWAEKCYHLSYGMVDLPTGKMKSREGTVVDADDLMNEMIQEASAQSKALGKGAPSDTLNEMIGLGALKYFLLKVDPKKRMMFNPAESIQLQGNTGPFIQYTHARICALLRKAGEQNISYENTAGVTTLQSSERILIALLVRYPAICSEAAAAYAPSVVANYAYALAKEYNQFYQQVRIFGEPDQARVQFRLLLSAKVALVIRLSMGHLGIGVPEVM